MKFFLAITLIVAVASADFVKPTPVSAEDAQILEIISAIQNPSTNPATAAALEEMLFDLLGLTPQPIAVGPAIVEAAPEPISVGPAIIDFPLPDGGEVAAVEPSPVAVPSPALVPEASSSAPLVQIILNINQAQSGAAAPSPAVVPEVAESAPVSPVQVVDNAPASPVQVVDSAPASPIQVVDVMPVVVAPVEVVDTAPVAVEPVVIGTPIIPSPAVVLPDELN